MYKGHLRGLYKQNPEKFMEELSKLSDKKLGCFCKPKACHGDFIVEVYEKLIDNHHTPSYNTRNE